MCLRMFTYMIIGMYYIYIYIYGLCIYIENFIDMCLYGLVKSDNSPN